MEIKNIQISFDKELHDLEDIASMTCRFEYADKSISIQLTDGEYRPDMGCLIFDEDGETIPSIENDEMAEAIKTLESVINNKVVNTQEHNGYTIVSVNDLKLTSKTYYVSIYESNNSYINKDSSSYQRRWGEVIQDGFLSVESAKSYIDTKL